MQCPNCRHVENGQWLYANGSRCTDDFSFEEFSYEDDNVYHTLPTLLAAQETLVSSLRLNLVLLTDRRPVGTHISQVEK